MGKNGITQDNKPVITKECVKTIYENKFLHVFDLQYEEGRHYYDATRRPLDDIAAIKSEDEFKNMIADAVSCFVILEPAGCEPLILLSREYRYPTGQFLLSVPAGLIDPEDKLDAQPAVSAGIREIMEETGIVVGEKDRVSLVNPLVFSTPGMTDESNALLCVVIRCDSVEELKKGLTQENAGGTEMFDGFVMLTKEQARQTIKNGRDDKGLFYSVYTWMGLMYFVSDMWKED